MLKIIIAVSLLITAMAAVVLQPKNCEQRGMRYETLESVSGDSPTEVCVPNRVEVIRFD